MSRYGKSRVVFLKFFGLFILMSFLACKAEHKNVENVESNDPTRRRIQEALENPDKIDFKLIQEVIIEPHCIKCHDTVRFKGRVDLSEYDFLIEGDSNRLMTSVVVPDYPEDSRFYKSILPGGGMPQEAPPLSADLVKLIRLWIEGGAPKEQGQVGSGGVNPPPERPLKVYLDRPQLIDYQVIMDNILTPKCIGCHYSDTDDGDILVYFDEGYEALLGDQIFTDKKLITPNSIEESYIFSTVAKLERPYMPPANKEPLNGDELSILMLWIMNGAIYESGLSLDSPSSK